MRSLAVALALVAPHPDPAPPLVYPRARVARAALVWSSAVLVAPAASGLDWEPVKSRCVTRRRCTVSGVWWRDSDPTWAVYQLRKCAASRRVSRSTLTRTRKGWVGRVVVDARGGVVCTVVDPPYVP